ncbi:TraM recognition domain-containing protein, partial [Pseudoalteromonas sp. OF5H-5]
MEALQSWIQNALIQLGDGIDPWLSIVICLFISTIAILGTTPIRVTDENGLGELIPIYIRKFVLALALFSLIFLPLIVLFFSEVAFSKVNFTRMLLSEVKAEINQNIIIYIGCYFFPFIWRYITLRYLPTYLSSLKRRFSFKVSKDSLSDIRTEVEKLKSIDYDVEKYFKDNFIFLGLDEKKEPIYVTDDDFKKNNINCIGPSQTGKGVLQQMLIKQAIIKGWNVIFIDQKPDDFIPDVMRETCHSNKRNLITLDLNGVSSGSYCPFSGGTTRERYSRFVSACDLQDNGGDGDFYKGIERSAISEIIPHWDGSIREIDTFLNGKDGTIERAIGEWKTNKFRESLNKVSSRIVEWKYLKTIMAKSNRGFNVERTLKDGGVAIVRGSVDDKLVIKFTRVIISEIISTVLRLGKVGKKAHTFLVIDEARFVISDELAKALATMLSKGCNTMISYQSVLDTENIDDKNINAKSVSQSINVNSNYTICYRTKDNETAEWLSLQTGVIQKSVARMENIDVNRQGGEVWNDSKSLNNIEEALIHTNILMSLPERVAVFLKPNSLAKLCYTSWIDVSESRGLEPKNSNKSESSMAKSKSTSDSTEPEANVAKSKSISDSTEPEANVAKSKSISDSTEPEANVAKSKSISDSTEPEA